MDKHTVLDGQAGMNGHDVTAGQTTTEDRASNGQAGGERPGRASAADNGHLRRSPLQHLVTELEAGSVAGDRGVRLRELAFLTMVGLRVQPDSDAGARLATAVGIELPLRSGLTSGSATATAVIWQGPDEFLVVAPDRFGAGGPPAAGSPGAGAPFAGSIGGGASMPADLVAALGTGEGAVVDLSANRTTLELSGPSARAVLEKGCALDLHPRAFGPGTAVSTQLGPVPVILWQTAAQVYRVMPRASFAEYVARWLLDAMSEFALPGVQ